MRGAQTRIVRATSIAGRLDDAREMLVTIYGGQLGSRYELDRSRENITLGRDAVADLVVDDDSVSRLHCQLRHESDRWVVEDLGSTNGTYVQGTAVGTHVLIDGELIKLGSTIFKFLSTHNIESAYHEEIYRMAIYDGLTQIHNRRYFEEFCDREISRAQRHGRALSLLLFDVDHFKPINDRFGHLSGDQVLRSLAATVRRRIRRDELFARYAGDEFVIVLPESRLDDALRFGELIRGLVEHTDMGFEGQGLRVTLSAGVAAVTADIVTTPQLLEAADQALYRAKQLGRNCVSA